MPRPRLGCADHDVGALAALPLSMAGGPVAFSTAPPSWLPNPYDNNVNPTCVPTALAACAEAWCRKYGGTDITIPLASVDKLYCDATNTAPADIANSTGADPLRVVQVAQAGGWDIGGQVPLVPDFAQTGLRVRDLADAADRASLMVAAKLTVADMDAVEAGEDWAGPPTGPIEGGHMMVVGAFDGLGPNRNVWLGTWGTWRPVPWDWLGARIVLGIKCGFRQLIKPGLDYKDVWPH